LRSYQNEGVNLLKNINKKSKEKKGLTREKILKKSRKTLSNQIENKQIKT
jgi:hypothetical protein